MFKNLKDILTALAIILSALFSWLATRSQSDEAKIREELTYKALQESVKEVQTATHTMALQVARIEGQLSSRSSFIKPPQPNTVTPNSPLMQSVDGDTIADLPVKFRTPPNYSDVVMAAKK